LVKFNIMGKTRTKKTTISITAEEIQQARVISRDLFGHVNLSGYVRYCINRDKK
jgi:hypothetical protein